MSDKGQRINNQNKYSNYDNNKIKNNYGGPMPHMISNMNNNDYPSKENIKYVVSYQTNGDKNAKQLSNKTIINTAIQKTVVPEINQQNIMSKVGSNEISKSGSEKL